MKLIFCPSFISCWHLANAFRVKTHICIQPSLSIFTPLRPTSVIDVSFQRAHTSYPQGWINPTWTAVCTEYTNGPQMRIYRLAKIKHTHTPEHIELHPCRFIPSSHSEFCTVHQFGFIHLNQTSWSLGYRSHQRAVYLATLDKPLAWQIGAICSCYDHRWVMALKDPSLAMCCRVQTVWENKYTVVRDACV